jgi:TP901 family phage tail tape measure protein
MAFTAEYTYRIIDRYSTPMQKIVRQQQKYITAAAKAAAKTAKFTAKLKKFGATAKRVGGQMSTRLTMPIAAVGTVGVIAFARLEKGLINVNNLLSKPELKKFGGDLERLQSTAIKAGFSIDDANKGLFDTVSALGAGKRGFDAFAVAQKLAIGGNTDLRVAIDGLTTLMSVYESDNVTALQAANALFSAQVKGKTTVSELSAGMGNVASTAKMAGVGMNEMLASLSAMTLGGINTDSAVTALNAALLALAKPQKDAMKLMDKMGISYGVANIKAKGLQAIFKEIAVAQKKFGEQKVMEAIPERRALKAIAALVSGGKIGKISEIMDKINSDMSTGDGLMRAFSDMNSSMSLKYARAMGQMTIALKSFIVLLAPAIGVLLEGIAWIAKGFSKLPRVLKVVIIAIALLLAVAGPLLVVLGSLSFAWASLIAMFPAIGVGFTAMGIGIGAMIWPILVVTTAFLAWAVAIDSVIQNWDTLSAPGFLKDLAGWATGADTEAPQKQNTLAEEAAIQQQLYRMQQKTQKVEVGGSIDVGSKDGTSFDSNIGLNTGNQLHQLSGAGAGF